MQIDYHRICAPLNLVRAMFALLQHCMKESQDQCKGCIGGKIASSFIGISCLRHRQASCSPCTPSAPICIQYFYRVVRRYVLSFVFFKLLSSGTSGIGQPQYSSFTVLGIVGPGGRDVLPACPAAPLYALLLLDQGDPLEFTLLRILISVRAICSA